MSRKTVSASFVVSAAGLRDFPSDGLPEIAMVGRSNVGKSTLINALVRKDVARTSATPGKTRLVNVYLIAAGSGAPFYLVDLPGYGHTGGGEKAQREFASLTAQYFASRTGGTPAATRQGHGSPGAPPTEQTRPGHQRSSLSGAILAIDARHAGLAGDVEACRWLHALGLPFLVVATKVDKLSQSDRSRLTRACELAFGETPLAVSATTGTGLDDLWQRVREWSAARQA